MSKKYPEWVLSPRRLEINQGERRWVEPSSERIDDRKAIVDILTNPTWNHKIKVDEIITYFRTKYEGEPYKGLGKQARKDLFIKFKGVCMWCKVPLTLSTFTVEHIKPRIEGGTDEWDNLGIACAFCNNMRDGEIFTKTGHLKETIKGTLLDKTLPENQSTYTHTEEREGC